MGRGDCLSSCGHCRSVSEEYSREKEFGLLWNGLWTVIVDCEWTIYLMKGVRWVLYRPMDEG